MTDNNNDNTTVKTETDSTAVPRLPDNLASMLSNLQNLIPSTTPHTNGASHDTTANGDDTTESVVPTDEHSTALNTYITWFRGTIDAYTVVHSSSAYAATTSLHVQLPNGRKFSDSTDTQVISTVDTADACKLLSIALLAKLFVSAKDTSDPAELLELATKKDLTHTDTHSASTDAADGSKTGKRGYEAVSAGGSVPANEQVSSVWRGQDRGPYVLHMKNLPADTTEHDLLQYFKTCELARVWLNNTTREAYVEFMEIAYAAAGYSLRYTQPTLKPNTERITMFDVIKTAVPYVEPELKVQLDQIHYSVQQHNATHRAAGPAGTTAPPPPQGKDNVCRNYVRTGVCDRGVSCKFAHTVDELSPEKRAQPDIVAQFSQPRYNPQPPSSYGGGGYSQYGAPPPQQGGSGYGAPPSQPGYGSGYQQQPPRQPYGPPSGQQQYGGAPTVPYQQRSSYR